MIWKKGFSLLGILVFSAFYGCSDKVDGQLKINFPEAFKISIKNHTALDRMDETVVLSIAAIKACYPEFNPAACIVLSDGTELASQAAPESDRILFAADFRPHQERGFTIRYAKTGIVNREYPKRTQAELSCKFGGRFVNRKYEGGEFKNVRYLRVPTEHTDHSEFIRYEGPGWESDKVGYRFYLDWRNAIDVYGKKIPDMVLQDVGLDGFESYHEMSDWGMDILKVGEALGLGSIGMWVDDKAERVSVTDSVTCEIRTDGPLWSQIITRYFGWKVGSGTYDLVSDLSILAGSRLTEHTVRVAGNPPNVCTGIVKAESVSLFSSTDQNQDWMYFGSYGSQSLAGDKLGMAILFQRQALLEIREDENSYVVVLAPQNGLVSYYFLAVWEKEPAGIQSENEFARYLDDTVLKLNSPLEVTVE